VAGHPEFCLDTGGAVAAPGANMITYKCNNISINKVHNQQFEYNPANRTLRSVAFGLCVQLGSKGHQDGGAITMEACAPNAPGQQWTAQVPAGGGGGGSGGGRSKELISGLPGAVGAHICMEWGDAASGSSGTMVAQAYRMIERMAPFYDGISGDQILVGCFGWLLDLVVEFTGNASQPYPFINRDAPQWSTGKAGCQHD
jgi:hypothetical protein